ncbi:MAG TPA: acyltransferase [Anaerolineae bacterium]|nr:acyltransferase [Anaerolineae bacterium]
MMGSPAGGKPQYQTATMRGGLRRNMIRYKNRVTGGGGWGRFFWQGTVLTLLSPLPTIAFSVLRPWAYRSVLGAVGRGCLIEPGVRLLVPRRIFLGNRVMVGEDCFLDANTPQGRIELQDDVWLSRGSYIVAGQAEVVIEPSAYIGHRSLLYGHAGIRIGRDALLANDVQLICGNHTFARRDIPIRAQPPEGAPIVIGDDVWLGASVIVLGGVTVGRGAVVAAGAVVTRDLPPYSIARGVPARVVGMRGEESSPDTLDAPGGG